jgi:fibro-slime domain-containing protein
MRATLPLRVCVAVSAVWLAACAGVKPQAGGGTGGATGAGGTGPLTGAAGHPEGGSVLGGLGGSTGGTVVVSHSVCGDGVRAPDEACDDGNAAGDDGCAADCHSVDPGYSCTPAGQPCHRVARCGDGIVVVPELCDDGNTAAGDGCSPTCKLELGWKCDGSPSHCTRTTCGDKIVEGAESCDDGNALPFDGCSADCQNEPDCKTGTCMSRCGDGIVVGEECDDGNNVGGDGCSADCKVEPGFTCKQPALGDKMLVPALYRDFRAKMPADFEPGATGRMAALTGIVKPDLDADGKPVYTGNVAGSYVTSATTFAEWYRDTPGVNHSTAGKLTLWSNGKGAYVNRYGANGEQWPVTVTAYYCGNVGEEQTDPTTGLPIPCTSQFAAPGSTDCDKYDALGYTRLSCNVNNGSYSATYQTALLDGTPTFFPVDGDSFTPASERSSATLAPPYDANYSPEAGKPLHNFSFTSEVRYWFQYDATKSYTLDFTGDDDVWVFINRKLAVDLGGIHTPVQGSVTFGAGTPAKFGLTDGQVYEVVVFQAERQTSGSSYRLTLSGFNAAPSECTPTCGDGIVSIGEECDDGKNTGGYGQCGPDCKLGPYCGDGIVQPDYEDCDDGQNIGQPCPSGCRKLIIN